MDLAKDGAMRDGAGSEIAESIQLVRQRAEQAVLLAQRALEARSAELVHSLSVMRATLESTADGILVVDESGKVQDFNEQFLRIWKVSRDVIVKCHREILLEFVLPKLKQPEEFRARTEAIYQASAPDSLDTVEFLDGRVIERYSKLRLIEDRVAGRVWSYRDITKRVRAEEAQAAIALDNARLYGAAQREIAERKRAEAEREKLLVSEREARARAERETRMKDEFLATLSHELRTPLNAILGWANLLRATDQPEVVAEGIEVIERNARAQAKIIEDLLDMSRIVSGKVRLEVQRIELDAVIKSAIESVSPMAAAKEIRVATELDPRANFITGDPARLQQVFWNLLTNALKFTPKGGAVRLELERADSNVRLRISDTGLGIAPNFLPHVFDRFRQADSSSTRRHGGLGLGLALVKNLVELHGGTVRAESAGENQGAAFTVTLPIAPMDEKLPVETPAPAPLRNKRWPMEMADFTGLRILAVDDELDARELVAHILSECGAAVATAGSCAEALELTRKVRPHLLITDIGMPDEDGYAVLEKIRRLSAEEGGAAPAIALTAFARAEDRERALRSGFQVHLSKPFEVSELIETVAKLTGRESSKPAHPEFDYEK